MGAFEPGLRPAAIISTQSFGDLPDKFHPHLHVICADGFFTDEGDFVLAPRFNTDKDMRILGNKTENPHEVAYKNIYRFLSPASKAGMNILNIEYLEDDRAIDTWMYDPLARKVRRLAPNTFGDSRNRTRSATIDNIVPYRESLIDWNWKLLGRRELYIPANNYEMWKPGTTVEHMCPPLSVDPQDIRYELRRVWVVEGTPRGKHKHPYGERLRYFDEDTWFLVMSDNRDKEGGLFRFAEFYHSYDYCHRFCYWIGWAMVNLQTGDYDVLCLDLNDDPRMPICNS